ncbi:MAG: YgiQ family radical SAM protein [Planctomycetota bacterium]
MHEIPDDTFLPTSRAEMAARGWDRADVVFVSGDAYVDHPSFGAAILGRWLEANGFKVVILSQPDWKSADAWRDLGPPRLFYAVGSGAMDSMVNHYTANRKRRNDDAYSPGGRIGLRPDRACAVYAQRCREAFKQVPVVTGGVEASLRRVAHYDYWSDKVYPGNLVSSKADLLVHGMGERTILTIAQGLAAGKTVKDLRDLRGVAYLLGKRDPLPDHAFGNGPRGREVVELPSFEEVRDDKVRFAVATRLVHRETNPENARRLTQRHGDRTVVVNPADLPFTEAELDALHELPYRRRPHPRYEEEGAIPAWKTIADSVQIMRGCFGGCSFCSITLHQGRTVQSRSEASILRELEGIAAMPDFKGHISDLGGPTANMYRMGCRKPEVQAKCRRLSCVHPTVCKLLNKDHAPLVTLMKKSRAVAGIEKIHIASGIRMDLAADEPEYMEELATHHVGGHLKVAPEHVSEPVLEKMRKPGQRSFETFAERFRAASCAAGREQYLVPYFIASHPGSGPAQMIELAVYLKRRGYRPRQVQDFIPAPMDVATCMYYAGIDPNGMRPVDAARGAKERQVQRALLQFFLPRNYFTVRRALVDAGRTDLIGGGRDCLIPTHPPKEAIEARKEKRDRPRKGSTRRGRR